MLRMIYPGPHFCLRDHLEQMISEQYTFGILFLSHFLSLYQNLDECWNTMEHSSNARLLFSPEVGLVNGFLENIS